MKAKSRLKLIVGLMAGLMALLITTTSRAQISFHIDIDTSSLIGNAAGPFSLDLQLNDGSGSFATPNTAKVSNFTFGGGSAAGAPTVTPGVSGSLAGTVTLTDTSAFPTEFFQQFTAGSTLGFDVLLTTLPELPAPDAFSVALLDGSLANIPTSGPGDSLVLVNIDKSVLGLSDIHTFAGTGAFTGVTAAVAVPEPSSALTLPILMLCTAVGLMRRRTSARRSAP